MSGLPDSGLYHLLLRCTRPTRLVVGALGEHALAPGAYVYSGTAQRGLLARVRRHMAASKRVRWHIDALATSAGIDALGVVAMSGHDECGWHQRICAGLSLVQPIVGFGASDCRSGCVAHLGYSPHALTLEALAAASDVGCASLSRSALQAVG